MANFKHARCQRANFTGAKVGRSDFTCADMRDVVFVDTWSMEANFTCANMERIDMHDSRLQKATFMNSNLRRANLRSTALQDANFRGACLEGADLRGAKVKGADFSGAFVYDAKLPRDANLEGAIRFPIPRSDHAMDMPPGASTLTATPANAAPAQRGSPYRKNLERPAISSSISGEHAVSEQERQVLSIDVEENLQSVLTPVDLIEPACSLPHLPQSTALDCQVPVSPGSSSSNAPRDAEVPESPGSTSSDSSSSNALLDAEVPKSPGGEASESPGSSASNPGFSAAAQQDQRGLASPVTSEQIHVSDGVVPSEQIHVSDCVVCWEKEANFVCSSGHLVLCSSCRRKMVFETLKAVDPKWCRKSRRDLNARELDRTAIACPICRVQSPATSAAKFQGSIFTQADSVKWDTSDSQSVSQS